MTDDPMLKMIAQLDQFRENLRNFTPVFFTYYRSLLEQGFTMDQAFTLTREFHALQWTMILGQSRTKE